ncbi:MAG: transposase [Thermoplasmataceae archaeon]
MKLQSYGGMVPMIAGSGEMSHAIGISKIRNPYLSNAVHERAVSVVTHKNEEFLRIFNREIAK